MPEVGHAQVVLNGRSGPQKVVNILWYRFTADFVNPTLMAEEINNSVVAGVVPAWLNCMSVHYTLEDVTTQLYNSGWVSQLFLPLAAPVNDTGNVNGSLAGPAQVAIIKFFLDPLSSITPPGTNKLKRSYLAMGPIPEGAVQDTGEFDGTPYPAGALNTLLGVLATELPTSGDAGDLVNERVSAPITAGVRASMLVTSATFRALASFRRSRLT